MQTAVHARAAAHVHDSAAVSVSAVSKWFRAADGELLQNPPDSASVSEPYQRSTQIK